MAYGLHLQPLMTARLASRETRVLRGSRAPPHRKDPVSPSGLTPVDDRYLESLGVSDRDFLTLSSTLSLFTRLS